MKTTDVIAALVEEPVSQMGYELVDVEFQKEQGNWVLTLYIDKDGGVTLEDCERVSREVEPLIDEKDPIAQSYYLSVSSPGLDRPLKNERDYTRSMGKDIVVRLYAKQDGAKEFIGTLKAYTAEGVCLTCKDGEERMFLHKDVALAKPHIEF